MCSSCSENWTGLNWWSEPMTWTYLEAYAGNKSRQIYLRDHPDSDFKFQFDTWLVLQKAQAAYWCGDL